MDIDRRTFLFFGVPSLGVCVMPIEAHAGAGLGGDQTVTTSWYGDEFAGNRMANGKRFDPANPRIAAHKTFPLGTRLALRYPETERTLEVVIQDRGPYAKDRDLDVSEAAALALGFHDRGVAELEYEILYLPES